MSCEHARVASTRLDKCCGGRIDPDSKMAREQCRDCGAVRIVSAAGVGPWLGAAPAPAPCDDCAEKRRAAITKLASREPCKGCGDRHREALEKILSNAKA